MFSEKKIIIAIDGYSSCGKSTLAKALAKELGYVFIDTGAMYRGVTLFCMRNGLLIDGEPDTKRIEIILPKIKLDFKYNLQTEKSDLYLNGENVEHLIRMPNVAANVSKIATIKMVREKLVSEQQKMGINGGIVMDGRDIGSVVFPNAELKLFITASPVIRAERRLKELVENGIVISYKEVFENLKERDFIDSTRKESPLIQTNDAFVIDTSELTQKKQFQIALACVEETQQKELK